MRRDLHRIYLEFRIGRDHIVGFNLLSIPYSAGRIPSKARHQAKEAKISRDNRGGICTTGVALCHQNQLFKTCTADGFDGL